jgi:hypothetical protein
MTEVTRLSVNLNPETAALLRKTADDLGLSVTETIRRSIALHGYMTDQRAKGNRILIDGDEETREVILL